MSIPADTPAEVTTLPSSTNRASGSTSAPGEWLRSERLRLARRLLETSDDPIEGIAHRAGYETAVSMRAHFARDLRTSPRAYRRTFRDIPRS